MDLASFYAILSLTVSHLCYGAQFNVGTVTDFTPEIWSHVGIQKRRLRRRSTRTHTNTLGLL
ncbi:hypothetical protein J6590_009280 [Homalodisca vitripennis]|nr:hypothetical protein J6590_009280 [Homalodisca vitripennis]